MDPESLLWLLLGILGALLLLLTVATQLPPRSRSLTLHRRIHGRGHRDGGAARSSSQKRITRARRYLHHTIDQTSITTNSHTVQLTTPCSRCGQVNAKKNCSYMRCATCCRGYTESVCRVHGTGYMVAERGVESAIMHCFYQCDISYTNLKICPHNLTSVGPQLVTLNLSNNRLKCLPEDIGQLLGLQELFLQYNQLSSLPAGICSLTGLIELDVKNNKLTHLPDSLHKLKMLVVLNLTNNLLTRLPSQIGDLINLQELSLHSNLLELLPSSFCRLTSLQMLYAGENKLTHLPDQFGNLIKLEELDLSGCNLAMLPESLSNCHSLVHIWLTGNKLLTLPYRIGDLQRLNELHIRNNCIKFLPASILCLQLYTFTAQNNCFLDEAVAAKLSSSFGHDPPPLLELSARTVYQFNLIPPLNTIPLHLSRILKYPLFCSTCEGPIFSYHHLAKFTYATVGVCYRVPIYHMYCSKKVELRTCKAMVVLYPALVSGLVLSYLLSQASSVDECIDSLQCFDRVYSECNETVTAQRGAANVSIHARPGSAVDSHRFSQVMAKLVCHHLNNSKPSSFCWYLSESNMSTCSGGDCNCTLAEVSVEIVEGGVLKPALTCEALIHLLQSSDSFFALAGFYVDVAEAVCPVSDTSATTLYDVPVLSWICVGLGLFFSLVFLSKPVWWDKFIRKCWH